MPDEARRERDGPCLGFGRGLTSLRLNPSQAMSDDTPLAGEQANLASANVPDEACGLEEYWYADASST
jgi:hypothetical protein